MFKTLILCGLLLVICITDQLSSVTGHSLKSPSARREKNGGKRTESLMEEIMNEIRDEKRQQKKSINDVRSTTHRTLSARLTHSFTPEADLVDIGGMVIRGDKLHVYATDDYPEPVEIYTYDASTFTLQRRLHVAGIKGHCVEDIASCPDCDVVFVADYCNRMIHVIDDVGQLRTQWSVDDIPDAISVNSQHSNVIVSFTYAHKLREYTPSGELVREITLPSDLYPQHAVQLDNDRYAVANTGEQHKVCIVNGNGSVVGQCYGGRLGSGVGQLYSPHYLALFGESLLVADYGNFRVLQFDVSSSLTYIGELINTSDEECHPWKMAVNEDDARLYVSKDVLSDCPIKVYSLIAE